MYSHRKGSTLQQECAFTALGLDATLVRSVTEQGYTEPTPIQQEAIPVALAGRDVVGSAQTGTGKTAAFLLPILQRLSGGAGGTLRALALVPTRELAEQVLASAEAYGQHTGLRAVAIYGGVGMEPQTRALRQGVDIVVATPGRLLDHMRRGHFDGSALEVLVLDEADRMLDMGFAPDVHKIIADVPTKRQTMLFSATISSDVDRLARRAMQDHAAVEIGRRAEAAEGVEHMIVAVDWADKRGALAHLLDQVPNDGRVLIFVRTKHGTDKLARHLNHEGIRAKALHGGMTQALRNRALEQFRTGGARILVATDVAARGIDVDDIAMVVNYEVPEDPEVYIHRVGRTARAGAKGLALTLLSPHEWFLMRGVEKLIGENFQRHVLPAFEPAVAPVQPREREAPLAPQGRSIRLRRGRGRGR
jgi:ATP-dependent RNA helicase RhlE